MSQKNILLILQKVKEHEDAHPHNLVLAVSELAIPLIGRRLEQIKESDVSTLQVTQVLELAGERQRLLRIQEQLPATCKRLREIARLASSGQPLEPQILAERSELELRLPVRVEHVPDQQAARTRMRTERLWEIMRCAALQPLDQQQIEEKKTLEDGLPDHVKASLSYKTANEPPTHYAVLVMDYKCAMEGLDFGKSSAGLNPYLIETRDTQKALRPVIIGFASDKSFRATIKKGGCDSVCSCEDNVLAPIIADCLFAKAQTS